MRALPGRTALAGGLVLLALTGCRSYSPTYAPAPYGAPVYQGPVYSSPPMLGPSGPPPGTIIGPATGAPPSSPGAGSPYPTYPTPVGEPWSSSAPPSSPSRGGDAPPFGNDMGRPGTSRPGTTGPRVVPPGTTRPGENPVPNYGDPNDPNFFESSRSTGDDPFGTPSPFQRDFQHDGGSTQRKEAATDSGPQFGEVERGGAVVAEPVSMSRTVGTHTAKGAQPSPYAYDAKGGYTWLRGVVDRDPASGAWSIEYSREPEPNDFWQGRLELAGQPELFKNVQPGDVVLVEGRPAARDGKAQYHVDELIGPLVPKTR